jgi:hypothetical protein
VAPALAVAAVVELVLDSRNLLQVKAKEQAALAPALDVVCHLPMKDQQPSCDAFAQ